jgi:hypothetical protein
MCLRKIDNKNVFFPGAHLYEFHRCVLQWPLNLWSPVGHSHFCFLRSPNHHHLFMHINIDTTVFMYKLANFVWSHTNVFLLNVSDRCFCTFTVCLCVKIQIHGYEYLCAYLCIYLFVYLQVVIAYACAHMNMYIYIYITIIFTYAVFVSVPLSFFSWLVSLFHGSAPRRMTETQADWDGNWELLGLVATNFQMMRELGYTLM